MAISKASIEKVNAAIDLIGLVGEYVTLKKKGVNYEACCPFHDEKTPSFKVNPAKGIYKCFGCGKGGDGISFAMDIESLSYVEAIRFLAMKYQIVLEESKEAVAEDLVRQSEKEALQIVVSYAQQHFRQNLLETEEGKSIGLSYFKERGLQAEIIEQFGLGYALNEWDYLLKSATEKQFNPENLEKAGLLIRNEESGKLYDRFRGRVTFPIFNISGKVIGFGARMLGKDKNQPKYINSPESALYDKSNALYGLFQARQAIRVMDSCYLTEGYMDVIAMHQAGISNTVASSGTSLTDGQIKLVGRFTKNITLLYDGDKAGIKASLRGIDLIVASGLNVRAVVLPNGHDPDSYAKEYGPASLEEYLKSHTQDFISFKAGLFAEEAALDPIKKAEGIESILETISLVADVIRRSVFVKEAARLFQVPEETLTQVVNQRIFSRIRKTKSKSESEEISEPELLENPLAQAFEEEKSLLYQIEMEIVRLLILHGNKTIEGQFLVAHYVLEQMAEIELKTDILAQLVKEYSERLDFGENLESDYFYHHPEESKKRLIIDFCEPFQEEVISYTSKSWEKYDDLESLNISESLYKTILLLKFQHISLEIKEIEKELMLAESEEAQMECLARFHEKKQIEKLISQTLEQPIIAK
jgi:DNA primase